MRPELFIPPPDHPLHAHVAHVFAMRTSGPDARETLLPRPGIEIVFNLGDRVVASGAVNDGRLVSTTGGRVSGLRAGPVVATPTGQLHLVGVSLRPESSAEFLPVPAGMLTGMSLEAADVFADAHDVRERLGEATTFAAQCEILLGWLTRRRRPRARTAVLTWARDRLRTVANPPPFDAIARELGVSTRQSRRIFEERIGLAPAAYARLLRFSDALRLMGRDTTLTTVAHRAGYFDQPHFCRDFRRFADMTPQEYLRRATRLPDVLFTPR